MNQIPNYTPAQLKVFESLQKIKMAWVMLWAIVALVAIVLAAFLVAIFKTNNTTAQVLLGVLDGTLGWCLKALIAHLFPSPFAKEKRGKASSTPS